MRQFEIELKNDKKKSYRLYNWFALVISLAGFSFLLFFNEWFVEALGAIILVIIYLLTRYYRLTKRKAVYLFDDQGYFLFLLCFTWLGLGKFLIAGICLVLGLVYLAAMQKITFIFKEEGVTKTNFPRREIQWNTLDNVILKDRILTMDFKNNHIIQGEVESSKTMNDLDFNHFVKDQLNNAPASDEVSSYSS